MGALPTPPQPPPSSSDHVVVWGTYDVGKPRVRLLLAAVRDLGLTVTECHSAVWSGIEDKSQLRGWKARLGRLWRLFSSYPGLTVRYLRTPRHELVLVPYPGLLDVLLLAPLARLRRAKIVWDVFFSAYDTLVEDRQLLAPGSLAARGVYAWEWLASRVVHLAFLDTRAHRDYFAELFGLPRGRLGFVQVGAEPLFTVPADHHDDGWPLRATATEATATAARAPVALFYGQFIPLQGIDVIVRAAARLHQRGVPLRFRIVGVGQLAPEIDRLIGTLGVDNIERIAWLPYPELPAAIRAADVALGVFGRSRKASSVIPNKVFQILATGQKLVTADTPALRELVVGNGEDGVWLVPPDDPAALADAVCAAVASSARPPSRYRIGPPEIAAQLGEVFALARGGAASTRPVSAP